MNKQELRLECLKLAAMRGGDFYVTVQLADRFLEYVLLEESTKEANPDPKGKGGRVPDNAQKILA